MHLPSNTVLGERFVILGQLDTYDTQVNLYRGKDQVSGAEIRIYEYFPPPLASRANDGVTVKLSGRTAEDYKFGLNLFQEEARKLSQLSHDHIPAIIQTLDEHGTAYRVSPHIPGTTLQHALEKRSGTLSEKAAQSIFLPIMDALAAAHRVEVYHGGISPASIFLTRDRETLLTGFRGASLRLARRLGQSVELALPGISPLEQYEVGAEFGPEGDLYCMAAALFQVITGSKLPEAPVRVPQGLISELRESSSLLSGGMRHVLLHALALNPADRLSDAATFRDMLADPDGVEPPPYLLTSSPSTTGLTAPAELTPVEETPAEEPEKTPANPGALDDAPPPKIPSIEDVRKASSEESVEQSEPESVRTPEPQTSQRGSALEKSRSTLLISAAVAAVVLLAGVFAILYGSNWIGDRSNEMSQFASLTAEADSLMAERNYSAAQSRYARAKELDEAREAEVNAYLERRLDEANQREEALRTERFREMLNEGRSHQVTAAGYLVSGAEEEALEAYEAAYESFMAAWDTHPGDSLALDLAYAALDQAELLVDSEGGNGENTSSQEDAIADTDNRLYEYHISEAELHLELEQYDEAREELEQALNYRPNDSFTHEQLDFIVEQQSAREQEAAFTEHVQRGETLRAQGEFEDARQAFERALDLQHSDEIAAYVTQLDSLLQAEAEARERFYAHRARGDLLFEEERYADAVSSYQQALAIEPANAHVSSRLEASQQEVEQIRAAEQRLAGMTREDGVFVLTDREPQLIGSIGELHSRVNYPRAAVRAGIEGRVIMQFVVEPDGSVSQPNVLRGIGSGADEEALRVIREAQFEPALVDGDPVRAQHTLWIQFRLENR